MQLDARTLPDRATLEADLCIVGAGPAGLTLAAELAGEPSRILLLESGSWAPASRSLDAGAYGSDAPGHEGLEVSRHRQVGGTAHLWNTPIGRAYGAKYVPLDAVDFEGVGGRPAWPFDLSELEPFYRRAQRVAGLGRFHYGADGWRLPPSPLPDDHPVLVSRVYQFGPAERFCSDLASRVGASSNVTVCVHAAVTGFLFDGQRVTAVEVEVPGGSRFTVHADTIVLACGGVAATRLLMTALERGQLRDRSGWLGRGFMEHPRDYSMVIRSRSRRLFRRLEFFDARRDGPTVVGGRVGVREDALVREGLPNASVTLLPVGRRVEVHWRVREAARRRMGWTLRWPPGYGWSRLPPAMRRFHGFQVLINLEEYPDRENRLTLAGARDATGGPHVRLHRRWSAEAAGRLSRLREVLRSGLDECGIGPTDLGPLVAPDPNSHHHMGTTRMGSDPERGVTDEFGRVYGTDNLSVCAASLFPAAGYANPTLTLVALALRLADQLRTEA